MSTESSAYSLGLSEMVTGSASQTLATFKQIMGDIELVAGTGIGEKIVGHIKNTMSDRHIVQKNFNSLLEDYRSQILPKVVSNWDALSVQEQGELASLNNFFLWNACYCGDGRYSIFDPPPVGKFPFQSLQWREPSRSWACTS